jgi:hypothetical protein
MPDTPPIRIPRLATITRSSPGNTPAHRTARSNPETPQRSGLQVGRLPVWQLASIGAVRGSAPLLAPRPGVVVALFGQSGRSVPAITVGLIGRRPSGGLASIGLGVRACLSPFPLSCRVASAKGDRHGPSTSRASPRLPTELNSPGLTWLRLVVCMAMVYVMS